MRHYFIPDAQWLALTEKISKPLINFFPDAIKLFDGGINFVEKKLFQVLAYRAFCYLLEELFDEAIVDCTKCLELQTNDHNIWLIRGYSFLGVGDYQKGIMDLRNALRLDPDSEVGKRILNDAREGKKYMDQTIVFPLIQYFLLLQI